MQPQHQSVVTAIYILFLTFLFVPAIAGVILAYVKRGTGDQVTEGHLTYQIRTFWIGLVIGVIGFITTPIGIGFLLFIALGAWVIVRCVKGILANTAGEALEQPETWLW
ncbi:MAG: DUF4870 family protein [Pseudomonadota bacterium]